MVSFYADFMGQKSIYLRKESNSHRTGLGHQDGHHLLVWDTNMAKMWCDVKKAVIYYVLTDLGVCVCLHVWLNTNGIYFSQNLVNPRGELWEIMKGGFHEDRKPELNFYPRKTHSLWKVGVKEVHHFKNSVPLWKGPTKFYSWQETS